MILILRPSFQRLQSCVQVGLHESVFWKLTPVTIWSFTFLLSRSSPRTLCFVHVLLMFGFVPCAILLFFPVTCSFTCLLCLDFWIFIFSHSPVSFSCTFFFVLLNFLHRTCWPLSFSLRLGPTPVYLLFTVTTPLSSDNIPQII